MMSKQSYEVETPMFVATLYKPWFKGQVKKTFLRPSLTCTLYRYRFVLLCKCMVLGHLPVPKIQTTHPLAR